MIELNRDRFERELEPETWKNRWGILAAIPVTVLAFVLRYLPSQNMEYLQAFDPYFLMRMSQQIAYSGGLPPLDFMSYFPYSLPTYVVDSGTVWIPAILHNLGLGLFFDSYVEYAQFVTPMFGALSVLVFYFLGKELFNRVTGVSAAFFLATIPGVMRRSSAGFFEKEAIGGFFMVLSLYFFARAWKRNQWLSGIGSGIALGLFSISWGGSQMSWLLYPAIIFVPMLLDSDIRSLVIAYTPTVIIGAAIPMAVQPSGNYGPTTTLVVGNAALLLFLWSRYLVENLSLMDEEYLSYYVPSVSAIGFLFVHFSALYSTFIASKYQGILGKLGSGGGGSVLGGTVAESSSISISQLSGQLNTVYAGGVSPALGALANIFGTWPMAFIGVALLGTSVVAMIASKWEVIEDSISPERYLGIFLGIYFSWALGFAYIFDDPLAAIVPPTLVVIGGSLLYYFVIEPEKMIEIKQRWYLMIPLIWGLTNILGASRRSRLVFLGAFPVAFLTGYTVSRLVDFIRGMDLDNLTERATGRELKISFISALSVILIIMSASAGYVSAAGIADRGDDPNRLWKESLQYMENETPEDSVFLSWWDYGYHIESLGERAAVADGGNRGFMTKSGGNKLPLNLADFFTSDDLNQTHILNKHSADYVILDRPMIGKYGAVSRIANRENLNETKQLITFSSGSAASSTVIPDGEGSATDVASYNGTLNNTQGSMTLSSSTIRTELNVPLTLNSQGPFISGEVSGAPSVPGSNVEVNCMIEDDGTIREFDVENPLSFGQFGEMCIANDPYYGLDQGLSYNNRASLVMVPRSVADSIFVQLMFGDGQQIPWADKVEEGSNGFVQIWKVDTGE